MDLETANNLSQTDFLSLLESYDQSYFSSKDGGQISDGLYDDLEQLYEEKFGARPIKKKTDVTKNDLPYYMGSLRKIKEEKTLTTWKSKYPGPYSVSDKIDGISALYMFGGNQQGKLFTKHRDGITGTDISHFLPFLFSQTQLSLHKQYPKTSIRGELVLPKAIFKEKYEEENENARNMVSGLANRKWENISEEERKKLFDVWLIAYQIFDCKKKNSEQIYCLYKMGFKTPYHLMLKDCKKEELTEIVKKRKLESEYEMDGVVLVSEDQNYEYPVHELPKHSIAFKIPSEHVETTVIYVQWNASKNGLLKPRVSIEPVRLCGAEVKWATGFNAKFIEENKIGSGATILISRSGDVIPHILKVISPSNEPDFPSDKSWKWNDNHVEIVLLEENDDVRKKKMVYFFRQMGVKFLGPKIIDKLFENKYNTLFKVFSLTQEQLMELPNVKEKSADRILESIHSAITNVSLAKIMSASGVFGNGFAFKKMENIVSHFPNLINDEYNPLKLEEDLKTIGGFNKTAHQFVIKLPEFQSFLKTHNMIKIKKEQKQVGDEKKENHNNEMENEEKRILSGKIIVFTGFRDKKMEERIVSLGGKIGSSISKKTSFVIVKEEGLTNKEIKARTMNIPVIKSEQFETLYLKS